MKVLGVLLMALVLYGDNAPAETASPMLRTKPIPDAEPSCHFRTVEPTGNSGPVVLEMNRAVAYLRINGSRTRLTLDESDSAQNCLAPGLAGLREFDMRGNGVRATLRKRESCSRDAEVCAGLSAGQSILEVSTTEETVTQVLRSEYCDI